MKQAILGIFLACQLARPAWPAPVPETGAGFEPGEKLEARVDYWVKVFTQRGEVPGVPENDGRPHSGQREQWRESLQRAGRYLPQVEAVFAREGLPFELGRMPFMLSYFDPAFNGGGDEAGLWAMPAGFGRRYLVIDEARDERLDPEAATRGAAAYFREAHAQLRSWPLAVTIFGGDFLQFKRRLDQLRIYDLGELLGPSSAYPLGSQERDRYAQLLAAVQVYRRANEYFPGLQTELPINAVDHKLAHAFSISYLCRELGLESAALEALNPALTPAVWEGRLPVPKGYVLHLPPENSQRLQLLRAAEPVGPAASLIYNGAVYRVREGDSALSIAKKYGISIAQLEAWNGVVAEELMPGRELMVREFTAPGSYKPALPQPEAIQTPEGPPKIEVPAASPAEPVGKRPVASAAPAEVPQPQAIAPAAELVRPAEPDPAPASASRSAAYQVRSGDSLWTIGREYGVSVERLQRVNGLAHPRVSPGQVITIPED